MKRTEFIMNKVMSSSTTKVHLIKSDKRAKRLTINLGKSNSSEKAGMVVSPLRSKDAKRRSSEPPEGRSASTPLIMSPALSLSNDEVLSDLFFGESQLLNVYCETLISVREHNPYHVNVLLAYFKSRGKMLELLKYTSTEEIEFTNIRNELFRGNTTFTRIYKGY